MTPSWKKLGIGLSTSMLLASTTALAQPSGFDELDENHDNRITLDEWHDGLDDRGVFGDRDNDKDDRLDANEFDAMGLSGNFDEWDENGDSYLDPEEYLQGSFELFDEDENGHWDGNEWDDAGDAGFWDV